MKANATLIAFAFVATAASACGDRLLVGSGLDGGAPQTGAAGTITTGAAGVTGTAPPMSPPSPACWGPTPKHVAKPLQITGEEAVTRLAWFLTGKPPSVNLLRHAELGELKTTDDLRTVIGQLGSAYNNVGVADFFRWWLDLGRLEGSLTKDGQLFPEFTEELAYDMALETVMFGEIETFGGGTFTTLMTAPYSYITARLAKIYGLPGVTLNDMGRTDLPSNQRAGLITQPALQALTSWESRNSPSARGSYMIRKFLCTQVPPPPADFPAFDPLAPNMTVRQALEMMVKQSAACMACHAVLDPPGLAFETFDAIGRWRTTDNGFPVDVSDLRILNLPEAGGSTTVDGPIALAHELASSPRAQECYARQWLTFATGGGGYASNPSPEEERVVQSVVATFRAARCDLMELLIAVLTSDPFLAPR